MTGEPADVHDWPAGISRKATMASEINELTELACEGGAQPLTTTPVAGNPALVPSAWWADALLTD
jgi:hypothetical protein